VSPVWEKGKRRQQVYLPTGNRWRDAWNPDKTYDGRTISVDAETHQLPVFIRLGSSVNLDLNQLWRDPSRTRAGSRIFASWRPA
jgi:alpha-D-xyloside xylohydrolase